MVRRDDGGARLRGAGATAPAFQLDHVSRRWRDTIALDDVSLTIEGGQRVLLAGPSGAGKSTLIRLLAGALRPSSGRVLVDGADLATRSSRELRLHRARCRIVEQGALLVAQSDVHRNVLAGRLAHMPWWRILGAAVGRTEVARVRELLEPLGLAHRQWDVAGNLSGGEQQRVAVARALISAPDALLADEPTSSLDPKIARDVSELLLDHARRRGATLVYCSHWINLARNRVDRILGIRRGRVVLDARPDELSEAVIAELYEGSDELRDEPLDRAVPVQA